MENQFEEGLKVNKDRFYYRNIQNSLHNQAVAKEDRQRFEVDLRKKKRLIAFNFFRGNDKFNITQWFRRYIIEKKNSWVHVAINKYTIFVQSVRDRLGNVVEKLNSEVKLEEFSEFFEICQELFIVLERLSNEEVDEFLRSISWICEQKDEFVFIVKISDFSKGILSILNRTELVPENFDFFSVFFEYIVEVKDLTYLAKMNVVRIVNEKIRKGAATDAEIGCMSKVIENNEKIIIEYLEMLYLSENVHQYTSNKLSGEHFSLILCSISTVDVKELRKYYGSFILDYFGIIMRRSSHTPNLNALIGLKRLAENNEKTALNITFHEVILLILDRLKHISDPISTQASSLILTIIEKNYKDTVKCLLRLTLIQDFSIKLSSLHFSQVFLQNTLSIFESIIPQIKQSVSPDTLQSFCSILYESSQTISSIDKDRIYYLITSLSN